MAITIEWVKKRIIRNEYYFSRHADTERMNDNLTIEEIETAIVNGRIIEKYEDSGVKVRFWRDFPTPESRSMQFAEKIKTG